MFNEANAVEDFIRDRLTSQQPRDKRIRDERTTYHRDTAALSTTSLGWQYVPGGQLPRRATDVLVEQQLREALVRLNPDIAARPERADEVLFRLRAVILAVHSDGLVRANEEFTAWLRGERSMPFGSNHSHVTVRLIDFDDLSQNQYVVTTQLTFKAPEKRFDLVLFVNGIPLIVCEAKTPVRPAISWLDGAAGIREYEQSVPAFFVPNLFSFATEGKLYRYGAIGGDLDNWAPWREIGAELGGLAEVEAAVQGMLRPSVILDMLQYFTLFATNRQRRKIKLICRYQQYHTVNQIVDRVIGGQIKKGLIWHFQGSGKSLLMLFAAQKLRFSAALANPTVLIVVDRIDLDTQITAAFSAADVPNTVRVESREELQRLLAQDTRKVLITTIFKFADAASELNHRSNIIVLVDEAHRTQEGDLGQKMRSALPNAFLFGLTGTPINKRDHNTFWAFGATEDEQGYMSRYSFEESIRDKATLPLHFAPRLIELHIDRETIDTEFGEMTGNISEEDYVALTRQAARTGVLVKNPERVKTVVADIARHFREQVEPNGFKAQVVTYDRESCVLYKRELDKFMAPEASAIVISAPQNDSLYRAHSRTKDEEDKLLDQFRDDKHPLKILIVTAKLLTGFDAPILQTMYLDKPVKEHNLLQAICRTNRPYPNKTHGLIVDYLGVFDDVAQALSFDDRTVQQIVSNLEALKSRVPEAIQTCLDYFPDVDRTLTGYEGLLAAQEYLPNNERRDAFAAEYSVIARLWEALSPDSVLNPYTTDYRWLSQIYESVRPPTGNGRLLWHIMGAKTLDLIHQNIHVDALHDNLEMLIVDADRLTELLDTANPEDVRRIEIQIAARLRRHTDNPVFVSLGQRLEDLKERHEAGMLNSIVFLKHLLELAKEVVEAEKEVDTPEDPNRGKAALTELFEEVRGRNTPIVVERIVGDIDEIVRVINFPGWQQTIAGEREVKQALRKTLFKYKLHQEQELFDRAYAYVAQYY